MGLFSKGSKAAAKVAVGLATAATTSLGGNYAKQYVQSQTVSAQRNTSSVSRPAPSKSSKK